MSDTRSQPLFVAAGVLGLIGAAGLFLLPGLLAPDDPAPDDPAGRASVPVPDVAPRTRPDPAAAGAAEPPKADQPRSDAPSEDPDPSGGDATTTDDHARADGAASGEGALDDASAASAEGTATFPMSREGIRDAIASQKEELQACYETLLDSYGGDPGLDGDIAVSFDISEQGRVLAAEIDESEIDSIYLEGCIATAMEDLRFEGGSAGSVTYPFRFQQDDGDVPPAEDP